LFSTALASRPGRQVFVRDSVMLGCSTRDFLCSRLFTHHATQHRLAAAAPASTSPLSRGMRVRGRPEDLATATSVLTDKSDQNQQGDFCAHGVGHRVERSSPSRSAAPCSAARAVARSIFTQPGPAASARTSRPHRPMCTQLIGSAAGFFYRWLPRGIPR
jgi:hypothetical protein